MDWFTPRVIYLFIALAYILCKFVLRKAIEKLIWVTRRLIFLLDGPPYLTSLELLKSLLSPNCNLLNKLIVGVAQLKVAMQIFIFHVLQRFYFLSKLFFLLPGKLVHLLIILFCFEFSPSNAYFLKLFLGVFLHLDTEVSRYFFIVYSWHFKYYLNNYC